MKMIMSSLSIENMQTQTETKDLVDLGEKKL